MSEKEKPTPLHVADFYDIPVTFVNQVTGSGHLNGVVNLTLAVANFSPDADGSIVPDLVVASRLRMDMFCAKQLYEALGAILDQMIKPANGTSH